MILLFLSQGIFAQIRENKPLPIFPKKPVKVLDEGITGWSLSLDGQWISGEMKIPVRLISTNEDQYETKINSLGNDNIEELQMYSLLYGQDSLVLLVKLYKTGSFKYTHTQKGWEDHLIGYYYVLNKKELQKLKNISKEVTIIELPLRDYGFITRTKKRTVLDDISKKMIIRPTTSRLLSVTARKTEGTGKIQFQIASLHEVFRDAEGVLNDFQLKGKSVYGKKVLFDYLYYEVDENIFNDFFLL